MPLLNIELDLTALDCKGHGLIENDVACTEVDYYVTEGEATINHLQIINGKGKHSYLENNEIDYLPIIKSAIEDEGCEVSDIEYRVYR